MASKSKTKAGRAQFLRMCFASGACSGSGSGKNRKVKMDKEAMNLAVASKVGTKSDSERRNVLKSSKIEGRKAAAKLKTQRAKKSDLKNINKIFAKDIKSGKGTATPEMFFNNMAKINKLDAKISRNRKKLSTANSAKRKATVTKRVPKLKLF